MDNEVNIFISFEGKGGRLTVSGRLGLWERLMESLRHADRDSQVARTSNATESLARAGDHSDHPSLVRIGDRTGGVP